MLGGTSMQAPPEQLPRHVAIIMDGNGRWAKRRGLPRIEGHRKGADSVREVTRAARELGIQALTLYAFSSQNWDRPIEEVRMLMALLRDYLVDERSEILDNGIRLTTHRQHRSPARLRARAALRAAWRSRPNNRGMTLCLALSYGGREAIVDATRKIVERVLAGEIRAAGRQRAQLRRGAVHARAAAARPRHPHLGRAAAVELPVVGSGLCRALLHRHDVARLQARRADGRDRHVPGARAALRADLRPGQAEGHRAQMSAA